MALQEKSRQNIEQYKEKVAESIGKVEKPIAENMKCPITRRLYPVANPWR